MLIPEDVKAMRLTLFPVTVENGGITKVDEGHAVHEPVAPLGAVEIHIVVENDSEAMTFIGRVEKPLISSITVV